MKTQDNQNNNHTTDPRMVKVAVRINPETIDELRAMYADQEQKISIRMVKIGGWRYPCAIYLLPEDEVKGFKRLQQNEAKQEQREARCWLPDGSGGFIRCDEEKHKAMKKSISAPSAIGVSPSTLTPTIRPAMKPCRTSTEIRKRICTWLGRTSQE